MAPLAETPIMSSSLYSHVQVSKEPDLLDGWWTSEYLFSLERRAIFSKEWLCIAHRSRFKKPGDYVSLEMAGFPILIIFGKDRIARAFHNVCRHRAYTITKKAAGSSLVLGCRYHGWSYDTKGNLVKAPQFDGIEGFEKSENGLFKIKTCTDRGGFIHINLDAGQLLLAPDCQESVEYSAKHQLSANSKWVSGWDLKGEFNWKTIGASDRTGIGTTKSDIKAGTYIVQYLLSMVHGSTTNIEASDILQLSPTMLVVSFAKTPLWACLTILPDTPSKCTVKSDLFSTGSLPVKEAEMDAVRATFACYIRSLEQSYGGLKGTQPQEGMAILPSLKAHLKLERLAGREINPSQKKEERSAAFCRAEKICKDLDILAMANIGRRDTAVMDKDDGLDW